MILRILIVDDEALARARVAAMLAESPEVEVLGQCANGPQAIAAIRQHRPDLVFLDVQMPEVSGFDVLRALAPEEMPAVIFVTAHDQHALEAFEVHALDYLLKPFKKSRFDAALAHARERLQSREAPAPDPRLAGWLAAQPGGAPLTRLAVKSGERTVYVKVQEVDYIEAAGNYAVLHAGKESHVLRETMARLEARLPARQFLRVNRSAIVNLDRVKELQPALGGDHVVVLKDGKELALTRGVREIHERLEYL